MGQPFINPTKDVKTFREQICILQDRGIIIENTQEAITVLQRVNYYRLIAYGLSLKDSAVENRYIAGTTFNKLVYIYEFDKKLRQLLLSTLESIEIAFRTHIAYHHAHEYGALGYEDSSNFTSSEYHSTFLTSLDSFFDNNKTELFVSHHRTKYNSVFPFWVAIEVLSFSALSKLFRNLHDKDRLYISKHYYKTHSKYIQSWLHTLTTIRNICAHHGRLYGKKLTIKPLLFSELSSKVNNDDLFAAVIILGKLLNTTERRSLSTTLTVLIDQYHEYIDISNMGFPENWDDFI